MYDIVLAIALGPTEAVIEPAMNGADQATDHTNGEFFNAWNTTIRAVRNAILRCELIQVDNAVRRNCGPAFCKDCFEVPKVQVAKWCQGARCRDLEAWSHLFGGGGGVAAGGGGGA